MKSNEFMLMKSLSKGNGGNRAAKVGNRAVSVSYVSIVWYETRNIAGSSDMDQALLPVIFTLE